MLMYCIRFMLCKFAFSCSTRITSFICGHILERSAHHLVDERFSAGLVIDDRLLFLSGIMHRPVGSIHLFMLWFYDLLKLVECCRHDMGYLYSVLVSSTITISYTFNAYLHLLIQCYVNASQTLYISQL